MQSLLSNSVHAHCDVQLNVINSKYHARHLREMSSQISITLLFKFVKNSPKNKFNKSIKQNHHKFAQENTRWARMTQRRTRNEWCSQSAHTNEKTKRIIRSSCTRRLKLTTTTTTTMGMNSCERQKAKSNLLRNWMRTDNFVLSHRRSLSSLTSCPK